MSPPEVLNSLQRFRTRIRCPHIGVHLHELSQCLPENLDSSSCGRRIWVSYRFFVIFVTLGQCSACQGHLKRAPMNEQLSHACGVHRVWCLGCHWLKGSLWWDSCLKLGLYCCIRYCEGFHLILVAALGGYRSPNSCVSYLAALWGYLCSWEPLKWPQVPFFR